MKTAKTLLILLVIVALIVYGVVAVIEWEKEKQLQQSTIDGLKKSNKEEADRLRSELAITRDSLNVAFETIRVAHKESVEARERSQRTIRDLQRIVYIKYESDSARLNALKSLYKSYVP